MDDKTLLRVKLPATGKHYDFWVPDALSMEEVVQRICQAMQAIEPDFFRYTGRQTLMCALTGQIPDGRATPEELGLVDGSPFVVV